MVGSLKKGVLRTAAGEGRFWSMEIRDGVHANRSDGRCAWRSELLASIRCTFPYLISPWPLPSPKEGCLVSLLFGQVGWKPGALIKDLKWKPVLCSVGWAKGRGALKGPTTGQKGFQHSTLSSSVSHLNSSANILPFQAGPTQTSQSGIQNHRRLFSTYNWTSLCIYRHILPFQI